MSKEDLHRNNPLQGVGLKTVLEELVTYYGFDILYAYLNMNCFKANPSIAASAKFLKKTDWAREKVELFYLYQYKNLPGVSSEQFSVAPRERIVPEHHKPGEPAVLSIEDAEHLQNKRSKNAASQNSYTGERKRSSRDYNNNRSGLRNKSSADNQDSSPDYNRSDDSDLDRTGESPPVADSTEESPAPVFNPWGNYKKKK